MKPAVEEHAPVTGGQDEAIPIDPLGIGWISLKILAEQDGADLCSAEREPEVSRTACVNGIDGQAPGLVSRLLKNFLVLHSRRIGKKILDLQRLAGDGENYLIFFIKWGARGSILINDVAGTELDDIVTWIYLDFLGPNSDHVRIFVLIDADKKIFIIWGQIT